MEEWSSWPLNPPSWSERKRNDIWVPARGEKTNMSELSKGPSVSYVLKVSCANSQNRPWRPASWCGPSAGAPPAGPCLRWTRWVWAQETCAGCCCTSQRCCDCRRGAVNNKTTDERRQETSVVTRLLELQMHSRVHRASRKAPTPDTTSQRCGRTPASGAPQEPGTRAEQHSPHNVSNWRNRVTYSFKNHNLGLLYLRSSAECSCCTVGL